METTATTAGYLPLILSIAPIILLIWLMVKKNAVPSYIALPGTALIIYLLQLFYFKNDFMLLNANAAAGIVATLTPITVIFGAIFFNRMMEATGCLAVIRQWLGNINPNPIAQLMIIGWAFAFMIEGASGFGTPAAIAAPILVGLGFKPMQVAVFALVMNSVPVSFGAVGTPTWFGFGELKNTGILSDVDILQIGKQTGIIHFIAGLVIPVIALRFITSWAEIRKNLGYIYLSILACAVPYVLLAQVNYEFPSLVGGGIGLLLSVALANKGIGLAKMTDSGERATLTTGQVLKALMPLGMLMIILIVTRVQELGLKGLLNDATPLFTLHLGVCDFEVSRALILSFKNIFGEAVNESYKTLYVPAFIPFVITVWLSLVIYRVSFRDSFVVWHTTLAQTIKPLLALFGRAGHGQIHDGRRGRLNGKNHRQQLCADCRRQLGVLRLLPRRDRGLLLRLEYRVEPHLRQHPAQHRAERRPAGQQRTRPAIGGRGNGQHGVHQQHHCRLLGTRRAKPGRRDYQEDRHPDGHLRRHRRPHGRAVHLCVLTFTPEKGNAPQGAFFRAKR